MADWNDNPRTRTGFGTAPGAAGDVTGRATFDAGLRQHMLSIYNYMASGVLLTGIVAILTARSGLAATLFASGGILGWIVMLAPLGFVFAISMGYSKFSKTTLQALFWAFAAVMGLSLSTIFLVYTGESIAATFFATAAAFAGLSLWGYTTKKDISAWGSFLIMGVIGLFIASIINIFIGSGTLELVISFLGVLIFAGLTAWDTQRLKKDYLAVQQMRATNPGAAQAISTGKMVVMGALSLYLDFINMFLFLLRFMGSRD